MEDYNKVKVTALPNAKLTVSGKKLIVSYTDNQGKPRKLVTADCFEGLAESFS